MEDALTGAMAREPFLQAALLTTRSVGRYVAHTVNE